MELYNYEIRAVKPHNGKNHQTWTVISNNETMTSEKSEIKKLLKPKPWSQKAKIAKPWKANL